MKRVSSIILVAATLGLLLAAPGNAGVASKQDFQPTVRDFGAVGDGKADDTKAFQRAIDSGRGDIYIPRGTYRLTKTVVADLDRIGPVSIVGSGTAKIVMAGPGPAIKLVGTHEGTADPGTVKENVWRSQRMPTVSGLEIVGA
ncbi:MAG: glycosyl hydrolase family 28-related protein, partial [Planctomycetota bacterium]